MEFLVVLALLALVALFITRPLWRAAGERRRQDAAAGAVAELEAARDAKYREIRDAELDHRTGKLSASDYEATDRALRAEAIEILRALDEARAAEAVRREATPESDRRSQRLPSREL